MIPILYDKAEINFDNLGLGFLSDCISATVVSGRNDSRYEATIEYPRTGILREQIGFDSIIKLRANERDSDQLFRVYAISKPMSGIITYSLEHVSYQLSRIIVPKILGAVMTANEILSAAKTNALTDCPFDFNADAMGSETACFYECENKTIRDIIFDVIDLFGGEVTFDNFAVIIRPSVGVSGDLLIQYGMNMTDITADGDATEIYTSCQARYNDTYGSVVDRDDISGWSYKRVYQLDCTSDFDDVPTTAELDAMATEWLAKHGEYIPNISVSYAPRW